MKKTKWLHRGLCALLGAALAFSPVLFGCSGGGSDSDDDDDKGKDKTEGSTSSLYRLNAKADCDFADGAITAFNADGSSANTFLYYPHQLDLDNDNVVLQAKVNFSDATNGRIGVGVISVSSNERDGYAFATASQKVRYGKSAACDPAKTENGQGWATSSLTGNACAAGTDYIFRVTLNGGKFVFDILDAAGATVLATKDSAYTTYFAASDKCYLAIGAPSGNTSAVKYSDIKATVNGTDYKITKIEDIPDKSGLTVSLKKTEVNKDGTSEVSVTCLDKSGNPTSATVDSDDPSVATGTYSDGKVVIFGKKSGTATLTITNTANPELKAKILVSVVDFVGENPAYNGISVYPANGATGVYEDGEWMIGGFTGTPTLVNGGRIKIYEVAADNTKTEVDTIEFADETQSVWEGTSLNVRDQLVRVEEGKVYFTPHIGKIGAGKKYLVAIPQNAISGKIGDVDFLGFTNDPAKSAFMFETRAAQSASATMTVDGKQDSTANFRTIQGALRAIGKTDTGSYVIKVAKGTYRELLYFNGAANVVISGDTTEKYGADVVVQYDNATCINGQEKTRNLLSFIGGNLVLENITLKNTLSRAKYGKADTQAEALGFDSGAGKTVAAYNCSFLSHQDTIRIIQKGFFYDCYIVGDVDFIWGETNSLACVLERCKIESVYEEGAGSNASYLLASKTGDGTQKKVTKGFVILNSEIICGSESKTYLGRTPWTSGTINQCAVIGSTITGNLEGRWFGTPCSVSGVDLKYVGWKEYGNTGTPTSAGENWGLIDDVTYNAEYSGRRAILNRIIDISDTSDIKFMRDNDNIWDIDALIAERNWNCVEDTSKDAAEGEVVDNRKIVRWNFVESSGSADFAGKYVDGKYKSDTNYNGSNIPISIRVTGNIANNKNSLQFKSGAVFEVPVFEVGDTVVVTGYPGSGNSDYKIGDTGEFVSDGEPRSYDATAADVAAGFVKVIAGSNSRYLVSINAKYTTIPSALTVTFDANGGILTGDATVKVVKGQKVSAPSTNPTKDGYIFGGWYLSTDDTKTSFAFTSTVITESITLKANWIDANATMYTVTFKDIAGTDKGSKDYAENTNLTVATIKTDVNAVLEPTGMEVVGIYTAYTNETTNTPYTGGVLSGNLTLIVTVKYLPFDINLQDPNLPNGNVVSAINDKYEDKLTWTGAGTFENTKVANGVKVGTDTVIIFKVPGAVTITNGYSNGFIDKVVVVSYTNGCATITVLQQAGVNGDFIANLNVNTDDIPNDTQTVDLTINYNDGGVTTNKAWKSVVGKPALKPTDPMRPGYDFKGWKVGSTDYDFTENVSTAIEIVAQWEEKAAVDDYVFSVGTDTTIDFSTFVLESGATEIGANKSTTYRGVTLLTGEGGKFYPRPANGDSQISGTITLKFKVPAGVTKDKLTFEGYEKAGASYLPTAYTCTEIDSDNNAVVTMTGGSYISTLKVSIAE